MKKNGCFIEAHLSGSELIWIDIMFLPEGLRRKGIGTQFYEEWEKSIPETVTLIKLMAADTGDCHLWVQLHQKAQIKDIKCPVKK